MNHCECGCQPPHCWGPKNKARRKKNRKRTRLPQHMWAFENASRYDAGGTRGPMRDGVKLPNKGHYGKYRCLFFANKTERMSLPMDMKYQLYCGFKWKWTTNGDYTNGYVTKDKGDMTVANMKSYFGEQAHVTPTTEYKMRGLYQ